MQMINFGGKIGSYAISTVGFDSWVNQQTNPSSKKTKKTRGTKEIVNKIFAEYAQIIDDKFWIEKFTNASVGKFPSKFTYKDGMLFYKKGTKSNTLDLPKNKIEGANACIEFFRVNGSIFSPTDIQRSLEIQERRSAEGKNFHELTWATANKKVQDCLLSYYVTNMQSIMKLTNTEMEQLRQTVNLGVVDKYFGKHNIHVNNKRIQTIDGLLWNDELRQFYIDPDLRPISSRAYTRKKHGPPAIDPELKDTVPNFGNKWSKYIDNLNKKWEKELRRQQRIIILHQNPDADLPLSPTDTTINSYTDTTDNDDEDE